MRLQHLEAASVLALQANATLTDAQRALLANDIRAVRAESNFDLGPLLAGAVLAKRIGGVENLLSYVATLEAGAKADRAKRLKGSPIPSPSYRWGVVHPVARSTAARWEVVSWHKTRKAAEEVARLQSGPSYYAIAKW